MLPTQIILVQCKNNPSQTHAVLQFQNIAKYQAQWKRKADDKRWQTKQHKKCVLLYVPL